MTTSNAKRTVLIRDHARPVTLGVVALVTSVCTACTGSGAKDWVPVYEEPKHNLVFENDQSYILEVDLPPGYISLYHEHKLDLLYVTISGSLVWAEPMDGEKRDADVKTGDLRFSSDNHGLPHIHRVGNVGTTPFHLIGIGRKGATKPGIDTITGDLSGMQLEIEKDHALVYRIRLQPGEKSGLHQHNLPFTNVFMSSGKVASEDGTTRTVKSGEFLWSEASEAHRYENAGTEPIEIVEMAWR